MTTLWKTWKGMDAKTRWFYFQVLIYAIVIVVTTLYCYMRLDFERSYAIEQTTSSNAS